MTWFSVWRTTNQLQVLARLCSSNFLRFVLLILTCVFFSLSMFFLFFFYLVHSCHLRAIRSNWPKYYLHICWYDFDLKRGKISVEIGKSKMYTCEISKKNEPISCKDVIDQLNFGIDCKQIEFKSTDYKVDSLGNLWRDKQRLTTLQMKWR